MKSLAQSKRRGPEGSLPPAAVEGLPREWVTSWISAWTEDGAEGPILLPTTPPVSLQLPAYMGLCLPLASRNGFPSRTQASGCPTQAAAACSWPGLLTSGPVGTGGLGSFGLPSHPENSGRGWESGLQQVSQVLCWGWGGDWRGRHLAST